MDMKKLIERLSCIKSDDASFEDAMIFLCYVDRVANENVEKTVKEILRSPGIAEDDLKFLIALCKHSVESKILV